MAASEDKAATAATAAALLCCPQPFLALRDFSEMVVSAAMVALAARVGPAAMAACHPRILVARVVRVARAVPAELAARAGMAAT